MPRFALKSVRAKLTVTTMLVMGGLLAALGCIVYFGAEKTLYESVDRDLQHRAATMGDPHGPPGGPPPRQGEGQFQNPPPRLNTPGLRPHVVRVTENGAIDTQGDQPFDAAAANQALHGWAGYSTTTIDDESVRLFTRPRMNNGRVDAVIQVPYGLGDIQRSLANLSTVLLTLVIPLGVLLSGVGSLFLVKRLIRPLHEITVKAEDVSAHSLGDRLPVTGEDEFAALATTLNAMLGRLESAFEQEQTTLKQLEESIVQQKRFTADASHELKTPLAVIKANTGLVLHMKGSVSDTRDAVQGIDEAADRMTKLVGDLLVLARVDGGQLQQRFEVCNLSDAVETAIKQVPGTANRVKLTDAEPGLKVCGSLADLPRIFVNLIDNALRHSEGDAPVTVEIERRGEFASVKVKDCGPGIGTEHLEHLFERFYRVDKSRTSDTGGTGLGLAICNGLVKAHGGQISVSSQVGKGTTFTVLLPAVD